jgi:xylulokinase
LVLAIDVGTGGVRASLLDLGGRTVAFRAREHDQIVSSFGRAEQRPADWWAGAVGSIRGVLDAVGAQRVVAVAACGRMHGTVLIDAGASSCSIPFSSGTKSGRPRRSAHSPQPTTFDALWPTTANPPSVAWPGFKLQWIARHQPETFARATTLPMPKDYINFRLTRRRAMDESEACYTCLFDARANAWSALLAGKLGVDPELPPPVQHASAVIGVVTSEAAGDTGSSLARRSARARAISLRRYWDPASRASIADPTSPALRR